MKKYMLALALVGCSGTGESIDSTEQALTNRPITVVAMTDWASYVSAGRNGTQLSGSQQFGLQGDGVASTGQYSSPHSFFSLQGNQQQTFTGPSTTVGTITPGEQHYATLDLQTNIMRLGGTNRHGEACTRSNYGGDLLIPAAISGLWEWAVIAGDVTFLADLNGLWYACGLNDKGQLGLGFAGPDVETPTLIKQNGGQLGPVGLPVTNGEVTAIAQTIPGDKQFVSVTMYGANDNGECGNPNNLASSCPAGEFLQVCRTVPPSTVAVGQGFAECGGGRQGDGTGGHTYAWGLNLGAMGISRQGVIRTPVLIHDGSAASTIEAIVAAGQDAYLVVRKSATDCQIWVAGYNGSGELGLGDTSIHTSLTMVQDYSGQTCNDSSFTGEQISVLIAASGAAALIGETTQPVSRLLGAGDNSSGQLSLSAPLINLTSALRFTGTAFQGGPG